MASEPKPVLTAHTVVSAPVTPGTEPVDWHCTVRVWAWSDPGKLSGPPELCEPPTGPDFELVRASAPEARILLGEDDEIPAPLWASIEEIVDAWEREHLEQAHDLPAHDHDDYNDELVF